MRLLRHIDPRGIAWVLFWALVISVGIRAVTGIPVPIPVAIFLGLASGLLDPWGIIRWP